MGKKKNKKTKFIDKCPYWWYGHDCPMKFFGVVFYHTYFAVEDYEKHECTVVCSKPVIYFNKHVDCTITSGDYTAKPHIDGTMVEFHDIEASIHVVTPNEGEWDIKIKAEKTCDE